MSGLDKITSHILEQAQSEADKILKEADEKVEKILADGKEEADRITAKNKQNIENECARISQMAESADRQSRKQALLLAKSNVIDDIINEALAKIKNMPKEDYIDVLKKILKNSMSNDAGEILFSEADKKLIGDDFASYCADISEGKLKVSEETANIKNGFIIRYGKIEQNCSIDSIFEDKYNELTDLVNSCLNA